MESEVSQKNESPLSDVAKAISSLRRWTREKTARTLLPVLGLLAAGCVGVIGAEATGTTDFRATPNYRATMTIAMQNTLEAPNSRDLSELPSASLNSSVYFSARHDTEQGSGFSGTLVRANTIGDEVIATFITAGHGVRDLLDMSTGYNFEVRAPQFNDDPYASVGSENVSAKILGDAIDPQSGLPADDIGAISVRLPKWMYDSLHLTPVAKFTSPDALEPGTQLFSLSFPKQGWIQGYDYFMTAGTIASDEKFGGYVIQSAVANGGSSGGGAFTESGEWVGLIPGVPKDSSEYIFLASDDEPILQDLFNSTEQPLLTVAYR